MLWVGGSIVLHGLEVTHLWAWPYDTIHHIAELAAEAIPVAHGFVLWAVQAAIDGVLGLGLGIVLIPLATRVIGPLWSRVTGTQKAAH
jgi:predicted DNA repair protein MutK